MQRRACDSMRVPEGRNWIARACKSGRGFYLKMRALPFTPRKGWLLLILRKTKLYCALASRLLIFFLSLAPAVYICRANKKKIKFCATFDSTLSRKLRCSPAAPAKTNFLSQWQKRRRRRSARGEIKGKSAGAKEEGGNNYCSRGPRRAGNGWIWIGKEVQYLMTPVLRWLNLLFFGQRLSNSRAAKYKKTCCWVAAPNLWPQKPILTGAVWETAFVEFVFHAAALAQLHLANCQFFHLRCKNWIAQFLFYKEIFHSYSFKCFNLLYRYELKANPNLKSYHWHHLVANLKLRIS